MRKLLLMLLLFSLVLPVFAEEERGLRVDASAGYTGSINSSFISVRPEALYDFGLLALGGGVNTLFGLTYSDIYIAPYAGFELGWFYLNGGAVFELAPPDPDAAPNGYVEADTALSPYFTLGANAAFLPIGPGKLGFDLSLGIIPTASPVQVVDDSDSILGNIIGTMIASLFSASLDTIKIGASIYYTVIL